MIMLKLGRVFVLTLLTVVLLQGCAPSPPRHQYNICQIFREYPSWYWATRATAHKWGVPISVQMAIIQQESHYRAGVRPPRERLLGFIPWARPTSAVGYTQAIDSTWRHYLHSTGQRAASRGSFSRSTDFIGWYAHRAHRELGISLHNADALYLAYHEGLLGYREHSYLRKPWLLRIAHHVQKVADSYHRQLLQCESLLPKKPWWRFW